MSYRTKIASQVLAHLCELSDKFKHVSRHFHLSVCFRLFLKDLNSLWQCRGRLCVYVCGSAKTISMAMSQSLIRISRKEELYLLYINRPSLSTAPRKRDNDAREENVDFLALPQGGGERSYSVLLSPVQNRNSVGSRYDLDTAVAKRISALQRMETRSSIP